MLKKAFTLVEVLISLIIVVILLGIVLNTYFYISNIATNTEIERNLASQALFFSQNLHTISDTNKIYTNHSDYNDIDAYTWFTDTLHFTWADVSSFYLTWTDCAQDVETLVDNDQLENADCRIVMEDGGRETNITDPEKVYVEDLYFRILPYDSVDDIEDIYNQWFWVFSRIYPKQYNENYWYLDNKKTVQSFYNIRSY